MHIFRIPVLVIVLFLLAGCGVKGTYSPPTHGNNHDKYTITLVKSP